jgi:hypothetical protein
MDTHTKKARLVVALTIGVVFTTAFWLLHSGASPLHEYAIWNPTIGNFLGYLCLPGLLAGMVVSGNFHSPSTVASYAGIFLQWFGLAYLCSFVAFRRSKRAQPSHAP